MLGPQFANSAFHRSRRRGAALYAAICLVFATVFVLTAQRGPAWQDSGVYQVRIVEFDLVGRRGLALAHPLLILLGKVFSWLPIGPLAWRLNVLSAVCAALAAANIALLVRRLAPRARGAAWLAGAMFALAHSVWWLATICESQALLAALLTIELHVVLSLLRRPRMWHVLLLGVLNGLGASTHNLALLALPGYVVTVAAVCRRRRLPWRAVVVFGCGWLAGAAPLLVLVMQAAWREGIAAAAASTLFGKYWRGRVLGFSFPAVSRAAAYLVYNFPNPAVPLAVVGALAACRRRWRGLGGIFAYLTVVFFLFAARYNVRDQFMFFLPAYVMVTVLAGLGLARLCRGGRRQTLMLAVAVSLAVGPALYAWAPTIWRRLGLPLPVRKDLPFRDPWRYWLTPWKHGEDSAAQFARAAFRTAQPGSTVIADGTSYPPLAWSQRVEDLGRGVRLMRVAEAEREPQRQRLRDATGPIFLVSRMPGCYPRWLDAEARIEHDRGQILLRVHWDDRAVGPNR